MNHYTLRPRTLVTGGAGFLGSQLCERLLADGHDVICLDNFIIQALRDEPITLYGDGNQSRSFCYVDDLIEGFVRLMNKPADFTGPVNLGNPGEFTMIELAEKKRDLTGSRSEFVYKPLPADDPKRRRPDIDLARRELDWSPRVTLEDGLKPTIAYFDSFIRSQTV